MSQVQSKHAESQLTEEAMKDIPTPENVPNPSSNTSVLLSNKGVKKVIFHEGFKFRYDKVYNGTEYYMCDV